MLETDSARMPKDRGAPTSDQRTARLVQVLVVGGFVALAVRLWLLAGNLAVSLPNWDQWDFLEGVFEGRGWFELFVWQHGPHRQGLGGLLYGILYPISGWSARVEALVAWSAIVAGGALCLRLAHRLAGKFEIEDLFIAFAFCSMSAFELFLGAPNLAHGPLPALLVALAAFAARSIEAPSRLALLAFSALVATFTGFGLALGPAVAATLGIELVRSWSTPRRRLLLGGALGLVVAGWVAFLDDYRWYPLPESDCVDRSLLGKVRFAGAIVGRAWGVLALRDNSWVDVRVALGSLLFLLLAATVLRAAIGLLRDDEQRRARWRTILVLAGFSLLFTLLTTTGRACLGIEGALASRYTIYSAPGLVGVYLWVTGASWRARRAVTVFLLLLVAQRELRTGLETRLARESRSIKLDWIGCFRAHHDLERCREVTGMDVYPAWARGHSRIEDKLRFLEANRLSLFSTDPVRLEEERLRARAASRPAAKPASDGASADGARGEAAPP